MFCDLHKLLVFIRKGQHSGNDILIRTRSNGTAVKFFISIRKGLVQALLKLRKKFDLIIYSALDQEIGDAIIDHIE